MVSSQDQLRNHSLKTPVFGTRGGGFPQRTKVTGEHPQKPWQPPGRRDPTFREGWQLVGVAMPGAMLDRLREGRLVCA